ncbi:MAG: LLM class F420-dependent oxidoreductase [Acidimicrobiales bacterium]
MRFAFLYPDCPGAEGNVLDAGPVPELAAAAEAAGWDAMAFTEHPAPTDRWLAAGGHQTLDPFVALGAAAAVTSRLRLITYLAVLPYRNPLMVAKAAASVDQLSGGRLVLGAGAGYLKGEFRAVGADFDARNEELDQALEVLPLAWRGETFSYRGRGFEAGGIRCLPPAVQQPIPIWLGGNSRLTLQRVAAGAQGWLPLIGPPGLATTTRTAPVTSLDDLPAKLTLLQDLAGDRFEQLDLVLPLAGGNPSRDAERHRNILGRMAELGAGWVMVSTNAKPWPAAREFIDSFAEAHFP